MATIEAIKSFTRLTLIGASFISLLTACPSVCPDAAYSFSVTATFSPGKDSVQLGDTIYLTSLFPTKLSAGNSGQLIDYANVEIGSTITFQELPTDKSSLKDAIDSFMIISKKGQIYTDTSVPSPGRVKQIKYQQLGSNYELSFGFVPKKKGIYCLTISDGFSKGKPNDGCDSAGFSIGLTNANQHLYYLSTYFGTTTVAPYSEKRAYCFKVY